MKLGVFATACSMLALGFAACSGGGGAVVAPNATVTVTPSATTTPTPVATQATSTPTATPASAEPTNVGVAPTPSPSMAASLTCPGSSSSPVSYTYTMNGSAQTAYFGPYNVWNGTVAIPANSPSGSVFEVAGSQNNYDGDPINSTSDPAYGSRMPLFYSSFRVSGTTTFAGGGQPLIPFTFISTCVASGDTYFVDVFYQGSLIYHESDVATTGMVTVNVKLVPNPLPSGLLIDLVLSH